MILLGVRRGGYVSSHFREGTMTTFQMLCVCVGRDVGDIESDRWSPGWYVSDALEDDSIERPHPRVIARWDGYYTCVYSILLVHENKILYISIRVKR